MEKGEAAMVTQLAKKQKGASLIEFMIASVIGVIAIGIIGSLFISSQRTASKRGQELLLLQNMAGTLQQIKEDAQRAGYDGVDTGSLKLSGATDTIHVQNSPALQVQGVVGHRPARYGRGAAVPSRRPAGKGTSSQSRPRPAT